jgi:uncharacterized RDD family membrane protein YckC
MAEPQRSPDQEFAEWYVWAKREISTDNRVCHGAAQAAMEALADGADRPTAIQAARRSQAGHSLALASQVPALRRSYAEWYDWARREIGGDSERLHEATHAAIDSLQRGGGSAEAAAAARSAVPPAVPPEPPPVGSLAAATPDSPAPPVWTHPGPPGTPGSPGVEPSALQAELPYAGFWRRLGAFAIDLVFVLVGCLFVTLLIAVLLAIALISTGGSAPTDDALVQVAAFGILLVLTWLYFAGLESSGWQGTVGKRMTGLLVTDRAGRRLSFGRSTGRYFAKILSARPILIGYLLAAFTPQKQALHDLIAGTLVVKRRGFRAPAAPMSEAGHPEQTAIGGEAQRA